MTTADQKSKVHDLVRALSSVGFGLFYIVILIWIAVWLADGPGDSEGMIAGLAGFFTCPFAIGGAWRLYRFRVCRAIIYVGAAIGFTVFLGAVAMHLYDVLTRPPGF